MARFYKPFTERRTVFYAICFALFTLVFAGAALPKAWAQDSDAAFTIRDVAVDITAESAAAAREQAFAEAQQKAFQQLAERLLSEQQLSSFTLPAVSVISSLIKDFEITQEQLSSVRYIGTYIFRFKNDAVRNYLNMQGMTYSDVRSKPVLVIPFYQWGAQTVLWGGDNPWLAAWNRLQSYQGLVPVIVPIGDLQDVADISDNEALTYKPDNLQSMMMRYNAGEAMIMLASPHWSSGAASGVNTALPPDRIDITIYRTDRGSPEYANKLTIVPQDGDADIFETAVKTARKNLQQAWKSQTMVSPMQHSSLQIRVPISSMQEWVETQNALKRVSGIDEVKLLSLKPSEARVELKYQGTEDRLRLALSQFDMTLGAPQTDYATPQPASYGWGQQPAPAAMVYELYLNKYKRY
ncbi:MAG: DUF2066 domain-containing protein [Rhodospirillales bacterium]|nr:DUF2066 domain-containing protein [Rhodospirillales bacterium]MCB9996944.1 DUF2066 domain-containing protein [Rhodospirillales bacterium]